MLPSWMASQIYVRENVSRARLGVRRTCRPAVWSMAVLSMFLNPSSVFTFLMMPSALAVPSGVLVCALVLQCALRRQQED